MAIRHGTPLTNHPSQRPVIARWAGPMGLGIGVVAIAYLLASRGLGSAEIPGFLGPITVLTSSFSAGLVALVYALGAIGLGRLLTLLLLPGGEGGGGSAHRVFVQIALGVGLMLSVSHLLGMAGLLSGPGNVPRIIGWGVVLVGLVALIDQVFRGELRPDGWPVLPVSAVIWAPALALLLVASANAPGALWKSEFGAYDALSYHLQLPKEWAIGERIWPVEHNVYSYLPSLVESAFVHLGAMMPGSSDPMVRLLGGEGLWIVACQQVHALLGVLAALLCGRCAWHLASRLQVPRTGARVIGVLVGALVLSTPWVVVVSTLAYNESALLLLLAGGVLVALDDYIPANRRAIAAGLLVGFACGCKPTALFMAGPVVGVLLLNGLRPGRWPLAAIVGSLGGIVTILPWLARNHLASGNPVFPFAAKLFGNGHWTSEQIATYAANHHAPASMGLAERVERLFSTGFGLRHEQWTLDLALGGVRIPILLVALACSIVIGLAWSRSRRLTGLLLLGLVLQGLCWCVLTHLQSRFLIPMLVPMACILGIGAAGLVHMVGRSGGAGNNKAIVRWGAIAVMTLLPLSQAARSFALFAGEADGQPNRLLIPGVGTLTGMIQAELLAGAPEHDKKKTLESLPTYEGFINVGIEPQSTPDADVYLLGDAAPLYILGAFGDAVRPTGPGPAASRVHYHTTWDRSLIGDAIASAPDDPAAWSKHLRNQGIAYVLVNYDELTRLIEKDRYYDPRVSTAALAKWLNWPESRLESIRAWPSVPGKPRTGRELFRIGYPGEIKPRERGGSPR